MAASLGDTVLEVGLVEAGGENVLHGGVEGLASSGRLVRTINDNYNEEEGKIRVPPKTIDKIASQGAVKAGLLLHASCLRLSCCMHELVCSAAH